MPIIDRRSLRLLALFGSLLVLLLGLASCQRASRQSEVDQAPDVRVILAVEPDPPAVGKARITVALADAAGQPIEGATVQLRGDMTHAGMQPVLTDAGSGADGVYPADFEWTMSGDWVVTVTAALPDGRTALRRFDLTVTGK